MKRLLRLLGVRGSLTSGLYFLLLSCIVAGVLYASKTLKEMSPWIVWAIGTLIFTIVLVLWILYILDVRKKSKERDESIKQELSDRAEREVAHVKPEKRAELEELRNSFLEGVNYLSDRGVGLDTLPWFLIIGPPGNGKTTLIRESGFDFAGFKTREDYKDPTRNCGWFFSDDAVIIDTAGRYAAGTQVSSSSEEWIDLLRLIKEQRPDRPINGILVAVSITEFSGPESGKRIKEYAESIRGRVLEVSEQLGVRVPIYIVFTMCDVVQGFGEFFADLHPEIRDGWWGVTLDPNAPSNPGQLSDFEPGEVFAGGFEALNVRLLNRRIKRLNMRQARKSRHATTLFLKNFLDIRDNLSLFVERLFHTSRFEEDLLFRGFYLTSGTQTERPLVDLTESLSSILGLPENEEKEASYFSSHAFPEKNDAKSYFVKDLFQLVVIPDQSLAQLTTKEARRRNRVNIYSLGISVGAACLFGALFIGSCNTSVTDSTAAMDVVQTVSSLNLSKGLYRNDVELFNKSYLDIKAFDKNPGISWGIYKATKAKDSARTAIYQTLNPLIKKIYETSLEKHVQNIISSIDPDSISQNQENGFRTYLLLGEEETSRKELSKQDEREVITNQLTNEMLTILADSFPESIDNLNPDGVINEYVKIFLNEAIKQPLPPYEVANTSLVQRAFAQLSSDLSERKIQNQILNKLRSEAKNKIGYTWIDAPALMRLNKHIDYAKFFKSGNKVGVEFTPTAFETFPSIMEDVLDDNFFEEPDWFDQRKENANKGRPDIGQHREIRASYEEKIPRWYEEQYLKTWDQFIRKLKLTEIDDLQTAYELVAGLSKTTAKDSEAEQFVPGPFVVLFDAIENQTSVIVGSDPKVYNYLHFATQLYDKPAFARVWQPITEAFGEMASNLNRMGPSEALDFAQETMGQRVGSESGPLVNIYDLADQDLQREASTNNVNIDLLSQHLLKDPILRMWRLVLNDAEQGLDDLWNNSIVSYYRKNLQGGFPFSLNADQDVTISNMEEFFGKGGLLESYFNQNMNAFLDIDHFSNRITLRRWPADNPDGGLRLALTKKELLVRGLEISDVLDMTYEVTPISSQRERHRLIIDGVDIPFEVNKSQSFQWPSPLNTGHAIYERKNRVKIIDESNAIASGEWAIFRFVYLGGEQTSRDVYTFEYTLRRFTCRIQSDFGVNPFRYKRFFSSFNAGRSLFQAN